MEIKSASTNLNDQRVQNSKIFLGDIMESAPDDHVFEYETAPVQEASRDFDILNMHLVTLREWLEWDSKVSALFSWKER